MSEGNNETKKQDTEDRYKKFETTITAFENRLEDGLVDEANLEVKDWSFWNLFYAWLAIACCLLFCSPMFLFPQHNAVEQPEYWWELMIPCTLGLMSYFSLLCTLRLQVFFKDIGVKGTMKMWAQLFLIMAVPYDTMFTVFKLIWVDYLGYNGPMPFNSIAPVYFMFPMLLLAHWYQFPAEARADPVIRKRIYAMIGYLLVIFNACNERNALTVAMLAIPKTYQPIMAIILPITREFDLFLLNSLGRKAMGGTNRDADMLTVIEQNCNYSAFLAISLGQLATEYTTYSILFVEFLINLYKVLKIVNLSKKIKADAIEKEKLDPIKQEIVSDLVVVELVEVIMPLAYAMSVLTAYYGPNGQIIGNIKNSYWSYTAIHDLGKLLMSIFQMFAIDFVSLAFGWVVLWKLSLLNCVREGCKALKGYIPHISITLAGAVVKVL